MVKECAWTFQHAIECHMVRHCKGFDGLRAEVSRLEKSADEIKHQIRESLSSCFLMPVDGFHLLGYVARQDQILDVLEEGLDWISYREPPGIPDEFQKEFFLLIDSMIIPIEELTHVVTAAGNYVKRYSKKQKESLEDTIQNIWRYENETYRADELIRRKVFQLQPDPMTSFYLIRLAEILRTAPRHAKDAGDMMKAML
jgi:hypothetical protein